MNNESNNLEESINKNCILYIYAKEPDTIARQQFILESYCESMGLNPIKIYKDTGKNFLDNKESLNLMLLENTNNDIIVFDETRLSRKIEDLIMINKMCDARNLRVFSFKTGYFVFDEFKIMMTKNLKK